jgi:alanine-synthesizing transaminase
MPLTHIREITPAQRLDNLRYAIRDLVGLADEVKKQGHKVLYLNVGDPNIFDFATPAHVIEAAYRAMRDNKNGYAPSAGVPEALEAIRLETARDGLTSVQDVFITNGAGEAVDSCLTALLNPGENVLTPSPDYPLYSAVLCKTGAQLNSY